MLATSLPVAQWLERPTGVQKVVGSIPVGDSEFSLSHARDMLNIPPFLISSPSSKIHHLSLFINSQAYHPLFVLRTCASCILMTARLCTKDFVNTIITAF